jgi:TldD protein
MNHQVTHENSEFLGTCFSELIFLGRLSGADFVEIFSEIKTKLTVDIQLKNDLRLTPQNLFGVGIRVLKGKHEAYASTSLVTEKNLKETLRGALTLLGLKLKKPSFAQQIYQTPPLNDFSKHQKWSFQNLTKISAIKRYLKEAETFTLKKSPSTLQSGSIKYFYDFQDVFVANSEGIWAHDQRLNQSLMQQLYLMDGVHRYRAYSHKGDFGNPLFLDQINWEALTDETIERGKVMLKAPYVEAGEFPVVLANGFGGVIFHEACGHLLETTCVSKGLSPFQEKMNKNIAHSCVSAIDTGLFEDPHAYGNLSMDDEGMPTQSTTLIEKGQLKAFMADRKGSYETHYPRTGSGRRQDFRFPPASRMRNTMILPGKHTKEEMINSIQNGYYCKHLGGGSVSTTGEFNFAVDEAYKIKNGKLGKPVKGALLIGEATDILKQISMCGTDLKLAPGFCGSVSGQIYVTVGQPHLKVDRLLIGGH